MIDRNLHKRKKQNSFPQKVGKSHVSSLKFQFWHILPYYILIINFIFFHVVVLEN
jgi:hypothetical protein